MRPFRLPRQPFLGRQFPLEPVELDPTHPLASVLLGFWAGPTLKDYSTKQFNASFGNQPSATIIGSGPSWSYLAANGNYLALPSSSLSTLNITGPISVFCLTQSTTGAGFALGRYDNTNFYGYALHGAYPNAGYGNVFVGNGGRGGGGQNSGGWSSTTTSIIDGQPHVWGLTNDGNYTTVWCDGQNQGSYSQGSPNATTVTGNIGNSAVPGDGFTGSIQAVWIFNATLDARSVADLSANPWRMLRPVRRFVPGANLTQGLVTVVLRADSSGTPGAVLATLGTIPDTAIAAGTTSNYEIDLTLGSLPALSNSTRYWIELQGSSSTVLSWVVENGTAGKGITTEYSSSGDVAGTLNTTNAWAYQMQVGAEGGGISWPAQGTVGGVGNVTANAQLQAVAFGTVAGAGTTSATANLTEIALGTVAGQGSVVADAVHNVLPITNETVAGVGSVVANAIHDVLPVTSESIAGVGGAAATALLQAAAFGTAPGAGSTSASPTATLAAQAAVGGSGGVAGAAIHDVAPITAESCQGQGGTSGSCDHPGPAGAEVFGTGEAVLGAGAQLLAAEGETDGVGATTATAGGTQTLGLNGTVDGAGFNTADGTYQKGGILWPGFGVVAGTGGTFAQANVFVPAPPVFPPSVGLPTGRGGARATPRDRVVSVRRTSRGARAA